MIYAKEIFDKNGDLVEGYKKFDIREITPPTPEDFKRSKIHSPEVQMSLVMEAGKEIFRRGDTIYPPPAFYIDGKPRIAYFFEQYYAVLYSGESTIILQIRE